MEEKKNIAITLQEAKAWYKGNNSTLKELALKAFSKEELEKIDLPKTWEEHSVLHAKKRTKVYFIDSNSQIRLHYHSRNSPFSNSNLCQTKQDAEAFLALMQLRALWHDYVGDFKFHWDSYTYHCIHRVCDDMNDKEYIEYIDIIERALPCTFCFPTRELAKQFLNNFKDLLEIAKPLL